MHTIVKTAAMISIVSGLFLGVRYLSSVVHYACLVPQEDCPPPFQGLADMGFYATGGSLNPLWLRDAPYTK